MAARLTRRDFLNGMILAAGAALPASAQHIDRDLVAPPPPIGKGPRIRYLPGELHPAIRGITHPRS
jgi:hypothetical protein